MAISTPVLQSVFQQTYASVTTDIVIVMPITHATAMGDLIYLVISANQTGIGGAGENAGITDTQGNQWNDISKSVNGGAGSGVPPVLHTFTETYCSLATTPLTTSDTITVDTKSYTGAGGFSGDIIIQVFSCTGPINQELGFTYNTFSGGPYTAPTHGPQSLATPRLNTDHELVVGTACVWTNSFTGDPPGWSLLSNVAQGGIKQRLYYQIVSTAAPLILNPTYSAASYVDLIIDSFYDSALPAISNLQAQGGDTNTSAGYLDVSCQYDTNFNDLIVVQVALQYTGTITPSVSDGSSNVYTLGTFVNGNGIGMWTFYCMNAAPLGSVSSPLPTADWIINWSGGGTVTNGSAQVLGISSCGHWARGMAGAGQASLSTSPSFTTGTLPQSYCVAFGWVAALTNVINDPVYTQGWGYCPADSTFGDIGVYLKAFAQVVETNSPLSISPTLGSGVGSLLNIETFYVTGHYASPNISAAPLAYADFITGTYQLGGAPSSFGVMFQQDPISNPTGGPLVIDNNGLLAKVGRTAGGTISVGGSAPIATTALLNAINTQISNGLVIICEFAENGGREGGAANIIEIDADLTSGGIQIFDGTPQPSLTYENFVGTGGYIHAVVDNPNAMFGAEMMIPGQHNMLAARFDATSMDISINGGAVMHDVAVDQGWPAGWLGLGVYGFGSGINNTAVHITFLGIYPASAVAPSALPTYSLPCTRPVFLPAETITQGHIY